MKKLIYSIFIGIALSASSCVVYHDSGATQNPVGSKIGVAKKNAWFGISFNNDVGLQAAAKNGNITKISSYSTAIKHGLFVTRYKTVVAGE